jgi:hypothetical protein
MPGLYIIFVAIIIVHEERKPSMKRHVVLWHPAAAALLAALGLACFLGGGCKESKHGGDGVADGDVVGDGDAADADAWDAVEDAPFDGCPGTPPAFLCNPSPPSTLLPPGTTELAFSVNSNVEASCRWTVGADGPYEGMTAFDETGDTRTHATMLRGLDPATTVVNEVYVRCEPSPEEVLHLRYRSLPDVDPGFPRTGNLWGWWDLFDQGLEHCARIDLFLGADFDPEDARTLRTLNPDVLIITSINTVEHAEYEGDDIPEDYYLTDVNGNRFEVWPGAYRLNLTRPEVAEYQARYAYQSILDDDLMVDGCFFDNFFTSQSWQDHDIYGNTIQLDANRDGVEDDPAWLDAAWREGVFHELRTWRTLMPNAYASGHLPRPPSAEIGEIFNGDSIGFMPADVLEGQRSFADFWETYQGWWEVGRAPVVTMVEASPPDLIAYGYDYSPAEHIPASTLEFARTFYPYMRFGLTFTLMNDGYFAYEYGDTDHGQDWWYDELDQDLGHPCGPPERVPVGSPSTENLITNGGFEDALEGTWTLWANADAGAAATAVRDTAGRHAGEASARIDITAAGEGVDWHISFHQSDRAIVQGTVYDLTFWARSAAPHPITVLMQKGVDDWRGYGLWKEITLTTDWQLYVVAFEAEETATDARFQFGVGTQAGTVWIDEASIVEHPPDVFRRVFTGGMVLLNGTRERWDVPVGAGYSRIEGEEAPLYETIVDDGGEAFTFTGSWTETELDSGTWQASGPFYHDWGDGCHLLDGTAGEASWDLGIRADGTYTIDVWWPAAPESSGWSAQVVYEVVAGGTVVASAELDQTSGGDEWHEVAHTALSAADVPLLRISNAGAGTAVADAVHVRSDARYNDGSPAASVELAPLDGIVLRRDGGIGSCP